MVGFRTVVVFNNNGKVTDRQIAYDDNYGKELVVFLPLNFNNRKQFTAELTTSVEDTYPKRLVTIEGKKSETDYNCYTFDLTKLLEATKNFKLGLSKVILYTDRRRKRFESELFRMNRPTAQM